jgi:hypothetical protein
VWIAREPEAPQVPRRVECLTQTACGDEVVGVMDAPRTANVCRCLWILPMALLGARGMQQPLRSESDAVTTLLDGQPVAAWFHARKTRLLEHSIRISGWRPSKARCWRAPGITSAVEPPESFGRKIGKTLKGEVCLNRDPGCRRLAAIRAAARRGRRDGSASAPQVSVQAAWGQVVRQSWRLRGEELPRP